MRVYMRALRKRIGLRRAAAGNARQPLYYHVEGFFPAAGEKNRGRAHAVSVVPPPGKLATARSLARPLVFAIPPRSCVSCETVIQ